MNLKNFTLNNFVPKTPFFYYNGFLPWEPHEPDYNFIVFDKTNSLATINSETLLKLKKVINKNSNKVLSGGSSDTISLFHNSQGVSLGQKTDDIVIDCGQIGEGEEEETYITKTEDSSEVETGIQKVGLILVGILACCLVIFLFYSLFAMISNPSSTRAKASGLFANTSAMFGMSNSSSS